MSAPGQGEQEVPRANRLYGRMVFTWFFSGCAILLAGLVLVSIEGVSALFPSSIPFSE